MRISRFLGKEFDIFACYSACKEVTFRHHEEL